MLVSRSEGFAWPALSVFAVACKQRENMLDSEFGFKVILFRTGSVNDKDALVR